MVCSMDAPTRNHLEHLAREAGIADEVLLPGFVSDAVLRLLYQSTELFVFPSLYEGFGLPVAEALACGAATIGSDTSSVQELLVPDARFDPADDVAIARAIERALTDDATRAVLAEQAARPQPNWDVVADRTIAAYEQLWSRASPSRRPRPLVAFVTPLPPLPSGVADYSFSAACRSCVRTATCTLSPTVSAGSTRRPRTRPRAPDGVEVLPLRDFVDQDRNHGGYDCVVVLPRQQPVPRRRARASCANARVSCSRTRYGSPICTRSATDEPGAVPDGFARRLHAMYDRGCRPRTGPSGRLAPDDAERLGVLMAAEVVELSRSVRRDVGVCGAVARDRCAGQRPRQGRACAVRVPAANRRREPLRPTVSRSLRASGS